MKTSKELMQTLSRAAFVPQEEMLEVSRKKGSLKIGIPKEISFQENRVALVPDDVALLEFLESNGIVPGAHAEVDEILPFNQTLNLLLDRQKVAIGFNTARYIFVEKVD